VKGTRAALNYEVAFCAFPTLEKRAIMTPVVAAKKLSKFDPKKFLSTIDGGRKIVAFPKKQTIFAQGGSADAVFYIQEGKVRLSVVSEIGKEATIGILNKGDFFGEGCLASSQFTSQHRSPHRSPRLASAPQSHKRSLRDSDEQIRHLLDLIRRAAPFSSQPAPPTTWRCYERFLRW